MPSSPKEKGCRTGKTKADQKQDKTRQKSLKILAYLLVITFHIISPKTFCQKTFGINCVTKVINLCSHPCFELLTYFSGDESCFDNNRIQHPSDDDDDDNDCVDVIQFCGR